MRRVHPPPKANPPKIPDYLFEPTLEQEKFQSQYHANPSKALQTNNRENNGGDPRLARIQLIEEEQRLSQISAAGLGGKPRADFDKDVEDQMRLIEEGLRSMLQEDVHHRLPNNYPLKQGSLSSYSSSQAPPSYLSAESPHYTQQVSQNNNIHHSSHNRSAPFREGDKTVKGTIANNVKQEKLPPSPFAKRSAPTHDGDDSEAGTGLRIGIDKRQELQLKKDRQFEYKRLLDQQQQQQQEQQQYQHLRSARSNHPDEHVEAVPHAARRLAEKDGSNDVAQYLRNESRSDQAWMRKRVEQDRYRQLLNQQIAMERSAKAANQLGELQSRHPQAQVRGETFGAPVEGTNRNRNDVNFGHMEEDRAAVLSDWKKLGFPSEYAYAKFVGLLEGAIKPVVPYNQTNHPQVNHNQQQQQQQQQQQNSFQIGEVRDKSVLRARQREYGNQLREQIDYRQNTSRRLETNNSLDCTEQSESNKDRSVTQRSNETENYLTNNSEYWRDLKEASPHSDPMKTQSKYDLPSAVSSNYNQQHLFHDDRKGNEAAERGVFQIGSQIDKETKRRQQIEYANALQRDQRLQAISNVQQDGNRFISGGRQRPTAQQQHYSEGRNVRGEVEELFAIESEIDKDEKRAKQIRYAKELDGQSGHMMQAPVHLQNSIYDSFSPRRQHENERRLLPHSSPLRLKREDYPSADLVFGRDQTDEKERKRLKQKQYADALKQQVDMKSTPSKQRQRLVQPSSSNHEDNLSRADESSSLDHVGPGWVIGPLGVPVRKTLDVGNRGIQKAFNNQVILSSPPKPPVQSYSENVPVSPTVPHPPLSSVEETPPFIPTELLPNPISSDFEQSDKEKKKQFQLQQRRALEQQMSEKKRAKEEKEQFEKEEQLRIERELKQIQQAFLREEQATKAKFKHNEDHQQPPEHKSEKKKARARRETDVPLTPETSAPQEVVRNSYSLAEKNGSPEPRIGHNRGKLRENDDVFSNQSIRESSSPAHSYNERNYQAARENRVQANQQTPNIRDFNRNLKTLPHDSRFMFPSGELIDLRADVASLSDYRNARPVMGENRGPESFSLRNDGEMTTESEFVPLFSFEPQAQPAESFKRNRPQSSSKRKQLNNPLLASLPGTSSLVEDLTFLQSSVPGFPASTQISHPYHSDGSQNNRFQNTPRNLQSAEQNLRDVLHEKVSLEETRVGSERNLAVSSKYGAATTPLSRGHSRPASRNNSSSMKSVLDMSSIASNGMRVVEH